MNQGSQTKPGHCPFKISSRIILGSFLTLLFFVLLNLLTSTSKIALGVDMSINMKSDVISAFNEALSAVHNNSGTIRGNLTLKSFNSKEEAENDYKNWMEGHSIRKDLESELETDRTPDGRIKLNIPEKGVAVVSTTIGFNYQNAQIDILGNAVNSTENSRKSSCDNCFKHNFNYVIQNKHICDDTGDKQAVELLILILTSHKNGNARNALRTTWLSVTKNNTANIRHAFLLGEVHEPMIKERVNKENERYRDIIKEDFIDVYQNLTYKTIMGFKWASTMCPNAQFVMKIDDDMWLNVPNIMNFLSNSSMKTLLQNTVTGMCSSKAQPIRSKNSKWYASLISYPEKFYPGFCSGTGYLTSMNVAKELYRISPNVPFFHLEDIYISLCIKKLGFKLKRSPGFNANRPKLDPCLYKGSTLITAHQLSPTMLKLIWNKPCRISERPNMK
ncbi:beta-1,3-galactosyltransferase 1-like [Mya arenaria]|uniref:beta-1,3-galactosyltransferase 1-like n=1 Tax=Mya arenaria TaxID=6604 RepID=UPI0022E04AD2|nr:beta-1,3-galactosyltransferase 1-like [Mya arenaria]XP_052805357.1 beta-1,3-galactosyltransferase 1-like [Mya arenaria]XP_052805358.1 beta-1,3-galactosyltransferase 1-like [Mya arenaria]XP_052805359.1 beta-1,3-galactosyltransferase 1-like [Mya arenaria]